MEKSISCVKRLDGFNLDSLIDFADKSDFKSVFIYYSSEVSNNSPEPRRLKLLIGLSNLATPTTSFEGLNNHIKSAYQFGILNYDLKAQFESLESNNEDVFPFPTVYFIEPEILLEIDYDNKASIWAESEAQIQLILRVLKINNQSDPKPYYSTNELEFKSSCSDKVYLNNIRKIQKEIIEGNVYEMNYCRNYTANATLDPFHYFKLVSSQNPTPFSCFVKVNDQFIISSSMERFLSKTGDRLVSQPIKGTLANSNGLKEEKDALFYSEKDRAENLMIVDLVRNDLNRCSKVHSVKVDELFGIYSYPTVHQMISTVSSLVSEDITFKEIIKDLFPMGSMTGAPKISAMKLIEEFEDFRRGIYSGAIGYRKQNGDFDFNVVIRSVLYNAKRQEINIPVGSAITYDSVPEEELKECNVKIAKLKTLISQALD